MKARALDPKPKINNIESSKVSRYRPEIDGLRAFAIVSVITNHFNKEILPGGYLGVDIFFVISGYVITSSLYGRNDKSFTEFITRFYERRIKRLVPALSLFVLISSITICFFNSRPEISLWTGLTSLFGVSNIYLLAQSTDYFAKSTELNVFTHTWSLGVEEQFYLLFPFIVWFSGLGSKNKNGARNLFIIVGILSIASLLGFINLYQSNQSAAYFLMPYRFWEMASGCLIFLGFEKRVWFKKLLERVPPILVLITIISVMYIPKSLGALSNFSIVALTSILLASMKDNTLAYKFFTNKKIVYLGLISYSLYLWHWGVLSISRWTIGIHSWSIPLQLAIVLSLSIASYQWIEAPLRKNLWFSHKRKTLILGIGLIGTVSSGLLALGKPLKGKLYTGRPYSSESLELLWGSKCQEGITSEYIGCSFQNRNNRKTLWIAGDSHSGQFTKVGKKVSKDLNMNLKLFTSGGTPFPPPPGIAYRKNNKATDLVRLKEFNLLHSRLLNQINEGDVIILSMRLPMHFGGTYYGYNSSDFIYIDRNGQQISQEKYFLNWQSSVLNLASIAKSKRANVIIQTPTPEWKDENNNYCGSSNIQWFNKLSRKSCEIDSKFFVDDKIGIYRHISSAIKELERSTENIYLLDSYSLVCPGEICKFKNSGIDIYSDADHISVNYAEEFISPHITNLIKKIEKSDEIF